MISPRLSLTVPNKYANFVGLVRKPWNPKFMQGFANDRLFMYIHIFILQPLVHLKWDWIQGGKNKNEGRKSVKWWRET